MANTVVAIFGASGAIGQSICKWFLERDYSVLAISRKGVCPDNSLRSASWLSWGGAEEGGSCFEDLKRRSIHAVVWAQGANLSDDIHTFNLTDHLQLYEANVVSVLSSLQLLLKLDLVAPKARLCVISSIWQNIARQNKLSYCITKSAIQGLVRSLSIDLGSAGHMINAVLPGALDTPMTRRNLSEKQIESLQAMTPLGTMPALEDVCHLVGFLCSEANTGITGQFIAADRGFSYARVI